MHYKTTEHQQATDHQPLPTSYLSTDWLIDHQAPSTNPLTIVHSTHQPMNTDLRSHQPTTHRSPIYRLSERLSDNMNYFIIYMAVWWYCVIYGILSLEFQLAIITYNTVDLFYFSVYMIILLYYLTNRKSKDISSISPLLR